MHLACSKPKCALPIVKLLVARGADVNVQDTNGHSVLLFAVEQGCADVVDFLVNQCSADVSLTDKNGSGE